jgi:hypothetical protein
MAAQQLALDLNGGWHCAECQAEGEALIAQYRAAQARGEFDAEGYTPNERKAQRKRVA